MEQLVLNVEPRTKVGKGNNRKLRSTGKLPGVLYGLGKSAAVTLDPRPLHKILLTETGLSTILKLEGTGLAGKSVLVKDYQVDPLSRQLVHVDLLEIDVSKKITVNVKLNFIGKSVGVAEGGVLNIISREVEISCLPISIPAHVDVDVTALKIGSSIHLDDLKFPEGVEKVSQSNPTLVSCVPPAKEEELAPNLTQAAAPEVITEKKPAEGEAAAAAPAAGAAKEAKKEEKK